MLHAGNWPVAGATLAFPGSLRDGTRVQDAAPDELSGTLRQMARSGFEAVDLMDSWLRPGDLAPDRLVALRQAADASGVWLSSMSLIRRSVIDARDGEANLAYSHRSLDAAADLDIGVVSVGLHQALTPEQQRRLWFWTATGHHDPDDDDVWDLAVRRLRELGRHAAELGQLLSLEMYEDTYLGSSAAAVRLVEAIGLDNVGLNPDVGNLIRLHRPVEHWREMLGATLPYANYWHVKNYQRDEDPDRGLYVALPVPLDAGIINYREAVAMAIEAGFQGIITTEVYGGDSLTLSAAGRDYLRRHVLPIAGPYSLGRSRVTQQTRRWGVSEA